MTECTELSTRQVAALSQISYDKIYIFFKLELVFIFSYSLSELRVLVLIWAFMIKENHYDTIIGVLRSLR